MKVAITILWTLFAGVLGQNLNCEYYCTKSLESCTGDAVIFADEAICLSTCAGFPVGTAGDSAGNTLGCRVYHIDLAAGDPATHCPHSSPEGGGVCVVDMMTCAYYCDEFLSTCVGDYAVFADEAACLAECTNYPMGTAEDTAGNTLGCRVYHLDLATGDPATHCPHSSPDGGGVCIVVPEDLCEGVVCDSDNPCELNHSCNPENGMCIHDIHDDGMECNDGDDETIGDVCDNGECVGEVPPTPTIAGCAYEEDIEFDDFQELSRPEVQVLGDCCQACLDNPNCISWEFRYPTVVPLLEKRCRLAGRVSEVDDDLNRLQDGRYIVGSPEREEDTVEASGCATIGSMTGYLLAAAVLFQAFN